MGDMALTRKPENWVGRPRHGSHVVEEGSTKANIRAEGFASPAPQVSAARSGPHRVTGCRDCACPFPASCRLSECGLRVSLLLEPLVLSVLGCVCFSRLWKWVRLHAFQFHGAADTEARKGPQRAAGPALAAGQPPFSSWGVWSQRRGEAGGGLRLPPETVRSHADGGLAGRDDANVRETTHPPPRMKQNGKGATYC